MLEAAVVVISRHGLKEDIVDFEDVTIVI